MEEPKATRAPVIPQEDASSPFLKIPGVSRLVTLWRSNSQSLLSEIHRRQSSPRRDDAKSRPADCTASREGGSSRRKRVPHQRARAADQEKLPKQLHAPLKRRRPKAGSQKSPDSVGKEARRTAGAQRRYPAGRGDPRHGGEPSRHALFLRRRHLRNAGRRV